MIKIKVVGNHSHIAISFSDEKTLSIANGILESLDDFEKKNPMLEIISWRLERFNDVNSVDYYLFIDHKKKVRFKNEHNK